MIFSHTWSCLRLVLQVPLAKCCCSQRTPTRSSSWLPQAQVEPLDLQAWPLGCCSSSAPLATKHVWYVNTMLNRLRWQRHLLCVLIDHVQALRPTMPSAGEPCLWAQAITKLDNEHHLMYQFHVQALRPTAPSGGDSSWRTSPTTSLGAWPGCSWASPTQTPSCMTTSSRCSSRSTPSRCIALLAEVAVHLS